MDPAVYRVLERLAMPMAERREDFCCAESPNTPKHGFNMLICTLPTGHAGVHVAHTSWALGRVEIADIWEQE